MNKDESVQTNEEASFPRTTLKELGNRLPVEIKGKQDQHFSFIDWGTPEEKKIAKIRDKNPNMGKFITEVLMILLDRVNGEDFHSQDEKKKILMLNQMPLANPLYMYFYLRFDQMGEEIALHFQCPNCTLRTDDFVGSLGDLDVDCKRGQWMDVALYKLARPFTLQKGDQLVDTLKFKLGVWDAMERMNTDTAHDQAQQKIYTIKEHLAGAEGVVGYLNPDEVIQKIRKVDFERVQRVIAKHNAGPAIQQEVECPKCKFKFYNQVNWSYDSFFGASSLPQA